MMRKIAVILLCIVIIAPQAYFLTYHRTKYIYNLAKYDCTKIISVYQMVGIDLKSFSNTLHTDLHFIDQPLYMAVFYNDIPAIHNLLQIGMHNLPHNPVTKTGINDIIFSKIFEGKITKQHAFSLPHIGKQLEILYKKHTDTTILNKITHQTLPPVKINLSGEYEFLDGYNASTILYKDTELTISRYTKTLASNALLNLNDHLAYQYNLYHEKLLPTLNKEIENTPHDPRIFIWKNKLYMLFNTELPTVSKLRRNLMDVRVTREMRLSTLEFDNNKSLKVARTVTLSMPNQIPIEKNWAPLVYNNKLYLIYSLYPELIVLEPNLKTGKCKEIQRSPSNLTVNPNNLRGGTNYIPINERQFISFAHHAVLFAPAVIKNIQRRSYYMTPVILTVDDNEQFQLTHISDTPILSNVIPRNHDYYAQVIFPSGLYEKNGEYKVSVGVNDQENYLLSIDKEKLLRDVLHLQQ